MANAAMYDSALERWARGEIDWIGDDIRALLVSDEYEPSQASDVMRADLGSAEVADAGSYRRGGLGVPRRLLTHDPLTNTIKLSAGALRWSGFTGSFRYIVIYAARGSLSDDLLIACSDLGAQQATNAIVELDYPAGVCEFVNQPQIAEIGAM